MQTLSGHLRKLSKSLEEQKALQTIVKTPNWEEAVKEFFKQHGNKQAIDLKGPFFAALLLLSQATGAQTADQLIKEIKKEVPQVEAPQVKPTFKDVQEVSKAIPMLTNPVEMKILTNPIKRPSFSTFLNMLSGKVTDASKDQNLKNILQNYAQHSDDFKANLIGHAFVFKVQNTDEKFNKNNTYREGLNTYLSGLSTPKEISQVGLEITKMLKNNPTLLKQFF